MPVSDNRFLPLPSEIRRRRLLSEKEATEGVQWKDDCPGQLGRKIVAILPLMTNATWRVYAGADSRRLFASDTSVNEFSTEDTLSGRGTDTDRLDCVAAVVYSFVRLSETDQEEVWNGGAYPPEYDVEAFTNAVNDILLAARIEWHYSEGEFVQRGNSVLHAEVVKPASILLDSNPKFARASAGFNTAITRLSENKPDVAITDAAVAVQEFFRALGIEGNSISDQLNAAQRAKIITINDRALLKPILDWTNADRSNRGNAHHHRQGDATKADAWLAIHVAGALMVRLSNEEPRDILAAKAKRDAEAKAKLDDVERKVREETEAARLAAQPCTNDVWNTPSNDSDEMPF